MEINVFEQDQLMKGALAYSSVDNAMSVRLYPDSTTLEFTAGMAVKLVDGTQKDILVDEADVGDEVYGFVVYNAKKEIFEPGECVVIAKAKDVMIMEASDAIAVGAKLMVSASQKVVTWDGSANPIIGIALTQATADGDYIKVEILAPLVAQATSFLSLYDTPTTFVGFASDTVKVTAGADALEFVTV